MRYVTEVSQQQAFDSFIASVLAAPVLGARLPINQNIVPTLVKEVKEAEGLGQDVQIAIFVTVGIIVLFLMLSIILFVFIRRRSNHLEVTKKAEMKKSTSNGFDNHTFST